MKTFCGEIASLKAKQNIIGCRNYCEELLQSIGVTSIVYCKELLWRIVCKVLV